MTQTDYNGASKTFDIVSVSIQKREAYKVINFMGQEVDENYKGLKIIIYENGDRLKVH